MSTTHILSHFVQFMQVKNVYIWENFQVLKKRPAVETVKYGSFIQDVLFSRIHLRYVNKTGG